MFIKAVAAETVAGRHSSLGGPRCGRLGEEGEGGPGGRDTGWSLKRGLEAFAATGGMAGGIHETALPDKGGTQRGGIKGEIGFSG